MTGNVNSIAEINRLNLRRIQSEFTEFVEAELIPNLVLSQRERRRVNLLEDPDRVRQSEQLQRVVSGVETNSVADRDVGVLFSVIFVLLTEGMCGQSLFETDHDLTSRL